MIDNYDLHSVPNVLPMMTRQEVVDRIEGICGSLKSIPWSKVSDEDLAKLYNTLRR